ncbi:MAG TPA: bifunctional phosphoglucose/phosphomannose isomerase [Candidatus Moranbacteria bacterium]|nr:bifunctional phosphoglucose/phosphomannose isomerase [Candidatus Moranbacteria bacterium]
MKNKQNLDKYNLRQVILDFPKQFEVGLELAKDVKIKGNFKSVEISGMGGSSLPANILRIYLNALYNANPKKNKSFGIYQNRFYSLPHEAYNNCLNIFASYSGNTEETIESLKEAVKHKLPSVGIATGGKLAEICQKNNIPCVILPSGIQPRYATGYFFSVMFQLLVNTGMIEDKTKDLVRLAANLEKDILALEKEGKKIAKKLEGKTPIIFSSTKYKSLAMIWKIKINENAKTPAYWNFYPELNHNEMIGYTLPQAKFHVITLVDEKDHPQNKRRMKITADLMKKKGIGTTLINMPDTNIFNTIFSTLIIGDWASYHLALAYNQDPTPVEMVEELKALLA